MPSVASKHADAASIEQLLQTKALSFDVPDLGSSPWVVTEFAPTPKVSSYLVAWADGEFVSIEGSFTSPLTNAVVPLRVYTTPEYIHQAQYALDVKAKVLPVYERIFDVAYPLPKLDTLVASDFDLSLIHI